MSVNGLHPAERSRYIAWNALEGKGPRELDSSLGAPLLQS